ncbi:hypothetical protein [Modestobacter sp. SYSU DS0290]
MLAGIVLLVVGGVLLVAARAWWRHVVAFNRRVVGPPRSVFQRRAEAANRVAGTGFLVFAATAAVLVAVVQLLRWAGR